MIYYYLKWRIILVIIRQNSKKNRKWREINFERAKKAS